MKELPKKYNHKEAEKKWQEHWEESQVYAWDESESRENTFVIDTPPPTVSGILHMGHIFSYTQADFAARYQRMSGKTVFYPMGFDDNGLPTERLVEKVKKVRATDMSREDFISLCEGVSEEARDEFRRLFKTTALSVDWNQEYHTISEESRRISQLSFLDLYHKGHAYRKLQPMLWDPVDQTALAQAEIVDKEKDSFENYIQFGLIPDCHPALVAGSGDQTPSFDGVTEWDNLEKIEIMTTRPELLAACVAVMCNPDDVEKFKGKKAVTPLFNVIVPIIPDKKVDKEKGSGVVMCCTFGDETDIQWWRDHDLPTRVILNKYGKLELPESEYSEELNGKKVVNAREIILKILDEKKLLINQEPITHAVKCAERSGAALEILPTQQWFIKVLDKKEKLKAKAEECNWYPQFMKIRMDQWIDGLNWDWCISRQRYFGVPFPVWYSKRKGEEGRIIIADPKQLPTNPLVDVPEGYTRDEVVAEADVMDTWATSSVSPQLSSKALTKEYAVNYDRHQKLFPADLRPQAHEIIRTWAFYTVVKAHLHEDVIPWKNLMISGWCLASDKTKMSKSRGNVVTPVDLIEEKGADAVRYWSSTSRLGTDTAFSEDVLKIGKKLVTKIWNATKFGAIHFDKLEQKPVNAKSEIITEALDKWILTRLHRTIKKASAEFEKFEYCNARGAIEDFFWNDFCDNYLEMVKTRSYNEDGSDDKGQQSAIHTVYHALEAVLKLFAPFVPHITEELYSHIFDEQFEKIGSIHGRNTWPDATLFPFDEEAEQSGFAAKEILDLVRKLKADQNVSLKYPLDSLIISAGKNGGKKDVIMPCFNDLANVTNAQNIEWSNSSGEIQTEDGYFSITTRLTT